MKPKKLIFNFFVNRNWKKLTDSRKRVEILADNRKSHHPIETLKKLLLHSGTPPYGFLGNTVILPWQYGYFYSYHSSLNFFGGIFHYRILTPYGAAFLTCDQEGRLSSETIVHNRHCSVNRDQLLIVFTSMTVCKHFVSLETRHAKNFWKGDSWNRIATGEFKQMSHETLSL